MSQRARIPGWLLFVIATAFALSSTMQAYWLDHLKHDSGMPDELPHLLALNFLYWYIPALLAPVIMAAATREQLRRQRWRVQVLVHIGGALAYSIVHTAAMMVLRAALLAQTGLPQNFPGWWNYTLMQYLTQLDWLLMTYLFLVGLAHALVYRRESEARALSSAQLETRLVEAQLQALQRQLHPHFLFNTLNAIVVLVRQQKGQQAEETLARFSDLLRAVLADMDAQEVTLARELEYLKLYLSIEQLRFSDRLRVEFDVDPELLDAAVPHMALQPLVENSIRHGVGQRSTPGVIGIRATRVGDALHVVVQDDGPGFGAQGAGGGLKLGLANTRARLNQLYGEASELRTETGPGGGALVTMVLPFHLVEEHLVTT